MIEKISNFSKILLYLLLISGLVFVVFSIGKNNLSNENLWFDESGQFWMAKGLNHYSPPLSKEGSVVDAIRQNSKMNLDPGGFTVLLHYWTKLSNSIYWIRMLPYLFFVFSMVCIGLISYHFSKSIGLGLASMYILPFIRGDLLYFAFEIRAFSMEYFGVALSLLLFIRFIKKKSDKKLLLLNICLALFCTSRYSFIVFAFVISMITFVSQKNRIKKIKFYLPQFIILCLIFFLSYKIQFQSLNSPNYTTSYMFKYLTNSDTINIIKSNLFSIKGIFTTLLTIFGALVFFYSKTSKEKIILNITTAIVIYNAIFCFLSFAGVHPWSVYSRWNISIQILNVISLSIIMGYLYNKVRDTKNRLEKSVSILFLTLFLMSGKYAVKFVKDISHYFRISPNSISSNIHALNIQQDNLFYISESDIPTWKYLNEYGSLKNVHYPNNTFFASKMDEPPVSIDYIIQSGMDDINYSDTKHIGVFKNISIYKPTYIYVGM